MPAEPRKLTVSVPATAANLGPGFDVLGLALGLHNRFTVAPSEADSTHITFTGYVVGLPADETNLFYVALAHLYGLARRPAPRLDITMDLRVPPGRGLGSSATAVVGGLVAANTLLGSPFDNDRLLAEAITLERGGHPDNVAPALLGGLVANVVEDGRVISLRVPFPPDLRAVLFIPDLPMDTVQGRALMPPTYTREDVVFNTSRVALLLAALTERRYDLLSVAMQDHLHQPYRAALFPLFPRLIDAALEAGAHGACLSGGGSSVLALATTGTEQIAAAMSRAASEAGAAGESRVLDFDPTGARVSWEGEDA